MRLPLPLSSLLLPAVLVLSSCGFGMGGDLEDLSGVVSFTQENAAGTVGLGDATKGSSLAQSFLSPTDADVEISSVSVKLGVSGTISSSSGDTLTLTLETTSPDSNSSTGPYPSGAPFTANARAEIDAWQVTGASKFYTFVFPAKVTLTKNTTYWIRIQASYPTGASENFITWSGYRGSASLGYANGFALYRTVSSLTWSSDLIGTNTDLTFIVSK